MKSNCKAVKDKIRKHIKEFYTPDELIEQVNFLKCSTYPTDYHVVYHMVKSGCFLICNHSIVNFLNSLGINPKNKEYNVQKSFELYCHLLARDAQLILKNATL